ncbi:MAG: arginine--tRNA ligase [Oscillospiraceae bacterium]|nr:arginine--tRNA ligase [Oscillospiraceae bacterium]
MMVKDLIKDASVQARTLVVGAVEKAQAAGLFPAGELPAFVVEIPGDVTHGDFATNIAMAGARAFKMAPPKIAAILLEQLELEGTHFSKAEMAGPGFINFFLKEDWYAQVLETVTALGEDYGKTDEGAGKKVMIEFVSANPTGPMHMGNARGGAIGDCLAAAFASSGYQVAREFYVNDAGNQIEKFGVSLQARYLQIFKGENAVSFPEDGYQGDDIKVLAGRYAEQHGDKLLALSDEEQKQALADFGLPENIAALKRDLSDYRIEYDLWFMESELHKTGQVDKVVGILKNKGLAYEKDGALWYKATVFGAEKDEVLIRQNGNSTYFAADIAYHYDKFALRGFDRVVNVWGADHHGHVARLKGAMDAVGLSGDALDIVLMQLVRLMKDGEPYRMSKRSGASVTLRDLLDLVPADAARFFFNMHQPGASMDFDLSLAVEQTSQNPVFYVQYAHARICSILKKLAEGGTSPRDVSREELLLLTDPAEIALIRKIAQLPGEISGAAARLDPSSLTRYAMDLATALHKFYGECRVQVEDEALMQARLRLCISAKSALANTLALMKIGAPESM